jgi:very-long-chain enoyl-CoA reductase
MVLLFGKRVLEVLYLHKYSGHTDLATCVPGGMMYVFYSAVANAYAATLPSYTSTSATSMGLLLYAGGILGNFWHHKILADLRPPVTKEQTQAGTPVAKKYVVPTGGLFPLVTCPHYFFEVVAWLGAGMYSQHGMPIMVAIAMASCKFLVVLLCLEQKLNARFLK